MSGTVVIVLLVWALCALGGYKIMESKGRPPGLGLALGLLLGVFGVIICLFFTTTDMKKAEEAARIRSIYKD